MANPYDITGKKLEKTVNNIKQFSQQTSIEENVKEKIAVTPKIKELNKNDVFETYDDQAQQVRNILNEQEQKVINKTENDLNETRKALAETERLLKETQQQLDLLNKNNIINKKDINEDEFFENFEEQATTEPNPDEPIEITSVSTLQGPQTTEPKFKPLPTEDIKQPTQTFLQEENLPNEQITPLANVSKKIPQQNCDTPILKKAFDIEKDMRIEEQQILNDLRFLWQASVERSMTIRLALQKLSNPNEDQTTETSAVKKVLSPLASLAPLALMTSQTASQASGAMIGGGMLGTLTSDVDDKFNKQLIHVSDYDLIMLAKEIDELQEQLVLKYMEYRQARDLVEHAEKAYKNAQKYYEQYKNSDDIAASTAATTFYDEAMIDLRKEQQAFLKARSTLEQVSSMDAIVFIEELRRNPELLKKYDQELVKSSEETPQPTPQ